MPPPPPNAEEARRTVELYISMASTYLADDFMSTLRAPDPPWASMAEVPASERPRMMAQAEAKLMNELRQEGITGNPSSRGTDSALGGKLCYKAMAMARSFRHQKKHNLERSLMTFVVRFILGPGFFVLEDSDPSFDAAMIYRKLSMEDLQLLLRCYIGIPEALVHETKLNPEFILPWHEEIDVMCRSLEYQAEDSGRIIRGHEWERLHATMRQLQAITVYGLDASAQLFRVALKNTGLAHHRLVLVESVFTNRAGATVDGIDKEGLLEQIRMGMNELGRHPDPEYNPKFELVSPSLQVYGAWRKLLIKPNRTVGKRHSCSAFIHKGHLYVAGGLVCSSKSHSSSDPRDVWRLKLQDPTTWEFVSKYPRSKKEYPLFLNQEMKVHGTRAYLFTGRPQLDFLDLENGSWKSVNTTYQSTLADRRAGIDLRWPWPGNICESSSQQIIGDRLLVFGGTNGATVVGSNLFMELNLKTLRWRRLGGYTFPQQMGELNLPGPRHSAASWVEGNGTKFCLLYGACDKRRPELGLENAYGPTTPWMYDDLWSWDIQKEQWRRERVSGNPPSPRFGMSCAYNTKLESVVIFGGVNYMCQHRVPNTSHTMDFLMYGDTFIWNSPKAGASPRYPTYGEREDEDDGIPRLTVGPFIKESRWRQVVTCGFPTYCCRAQLVCDPDTGKTYLYGGYARAETVPSRHRSEETALQHAKYDPTFAKSSTYFFGSNAVDNAEEKQAYHVFGDIWQLCIDVPGGDFETINLEDEIRAAQPGPWQRCLELAKGERTFVQRNVK